MGECKDEYHVIDYIDNDKINNKHANLQAVTQENTALGYNDPIQVPRREMDAMNQQPYARLFT